MVLNLKHTFRIEMYIRTGIKFAKYLVSLPQHQQLDHLPPEDAELAIDKLTISQICPLTMLPIRYPCKGQACTHLEVEMFYLEL